MMKTIKKINAGLLIISAVILTQCTFLNKHNVIQKPNIIVILADDFDIQGEKFHRATADAMYTALILQRGLKTQKQPYCFKNLLEDAGGAKKIKPFISH